MAVLEREGLTTPAHNAPGTKRKSTRDLQDMDSRGTVKASHLLVKHRCPATMHACHGLQGVTRPVNVTPMSPNILPVFSWVNDLRRMLLLLLPDDDL